MEAKVRHLSAIVLLFLFVDGAYSAADIHVVALMAGKAVVSINGGKTQTLSVGQVSPEGVKLVAASSESATFESGGKRQTLAAGQGRAVASVAPAKGGNRVTLTADSRGHFVTTGVVNGVSLRFLVDTGATSVALSSADARRVGINYLVGVRSQSQTANGLVPVYAVKLDTLRIGEITVNNVDAVVIEGDRLAVALLGMSFLNRMEMRRDGQTMTLTRRY